MEYEQHLIMLCAAIALVVGLLKRDKPVEIATESTKLFALLLVGLVLFALVVFVLPERSVFLH